MALNTFNQTNITNAGLTEVVDVTQLADVRLLVLATNLTLVANVDISTSAIPSEGTSIVYVINGTPNVDLNGNSFRIEGTDIDEEQLKTGLIFYIVSQGSDWNVPFICPTFDPSSGETTLNGKFIVDGTVPVAALEALTSAQIIVGNGSNVPTAVAVTGDVTITNAGVTAIGAGVVVNADINASAAITRTKIANGTASHVVINDGSGTLSSEAQLAKSRGGFGTDVSASTGFVKFASGTLAITTIIDAVPLQVSFETDYVGDFKITMPYAGTVTSIYGYAVKAIAGGDAGTIQMKNNGGTSTTGGLITFALGDIRGTAYTATPSANNTFIAGDILTFTTAKGTPGGVVQLSITTTRLS